MTAGVGAVTNTMAKIVGAQVLKDLQMFVAAFDTLFGGFRNRAQQTFELLQTKETAFLVVAAPEADALREAAYFVERLDAEEMPLAGLVVNRATPTARGAVGRAGGRGRGAAGVRRRRETAGLTAGLLRLHADRMRRVARETGCVSGSRPRTRTCRPWSCRRCRTDVHDLDGLREIGVAAGRPPDATGRALEKAQCPRAWMRLAGIPPHRSGVRRRRRRSCRLLVLGLSGLEEPAPRDDVGTLAEDGPALTLGHAAPDAPLDLVVEGLGEALGLHGAAGAHLLRPVLRGATDEELVGRACLHCACDAQSSFHVILRIPFLVTCSPKQAVEPSSRDSNVKTDTTRTDTRGPNRIARM